MYLNLTAMCLIITLSYLCIDRYRYIDDIHTLCSVSLENLSCHSHLPTNAEILPGTLWAGASLLLEDRNIGV